MYLTDSSHLYPCPSNDCLPALEPFLLQFGPGGLCPALRVRTRGEESEGESSAAGTGQLGVEAVGGADGVDPIEAGVGHTQGAEETLVGVDQLLENSR